MTKEFDTQHVAGYLKLMMKVFDADQLVIVRDGAGLMIHRNRPDFQPGPQTALRAIPETLRWSSSRPPLENISKRQENENTTRR